MLPRAEGEVDPFALPSEARLQWLLIVGLAFLTIAGLATQVVHEPLFLSYVFLADPELVAAMKSWHAREINEHELMNALIAFASKEDPEAIHGQTRRALTRGLWLAFVFLSFFLYWQRTRSRAERYKLLVPHRAPSIFAELRALPGLRRFPVLGTRPGLLDSRAGAFKGCSVLVIAGEPCTIEKGWNAGYRVTVLHEVAHFVNRDARARLFIRPFAAAALVVSALPVLAYSLIQADSAGNVVSLLVRFTPLLFAAWLLWAPWAKRREHDADLRVASWGWREALEMRLALPAAHEAHRSWRSRILGSAQPTAAERLHVLKDRTLVYCFSLRLALATGLVLGFLGSHLNAFIGDAAALSNLLYLPFLPASATLLLGLLALVAFPLVFCFLTQLAIGPLTFQALRSAASDALESRSPAATWWTIVRTSIAIGCGIETSFLVWWGPTSNTSDPWLLNVLGWILVFTCISLLWIVQAYGIPRLFVSSWQASAPPRRMPWVYGWWLSLHAMALFWLTMLLRWLLALPAHSELLPATAFFGSTPYTLYLYTIGVAVFGLLPALLCSIGTSLLLFLMVLRTNLRKRTCSSCDATLYAWHVIDRACPTCNQPLAAWLYQKSSKTVGTTGASAKWQGAAP